MSRILALQGAPRETIQGALAAFAARRRAEGWRVAGLIEVAAGPDGPGCAGQALLDLATGVLHHIGQDLGRHASACHLDSSGVAAACQSAMNALAEGCDVLVLAKFGKLEAARSGLVDAFGRAMERDVPVLTSVAPSSMASWAAFEGGLARLAAPDADIIDAWWRALAEPAAHPRTETHELASPHHGLAVDPH